MQVFDYQYPADAGEDDDSRGNTADDHFRFAGGIRIPFAVEVHGEQRRGRIELGAERSHQRHDHAAGHHATQTVRQDLRHHRGVRRVAAGLEIGTGRLGERKGDHARHQEDEDRRELEETGQDRAAPGFLLVTTRQHALDDVLIRTPVPEADDGRTGQNRQPRPVGIVIGTN